jgi:hypothetical protein
VESTRNSVQNFVHTTAISVSRRRCEFRVGFSINVGESYLMAKNGSEYVTLAGYIDGNSGFMITENLLYFLLSYLPMYNLHRKIVTRVRRSLRRI